MAAFFANLRNTVIAGFVLALLVFVLAWQTGMLNGTTFWPFFMRWLHVVCGVMWIGLLWYFNFVSTPTMPKIPAELKPALGKFITPAALFWFRWAALATIVLGIGLASIYHYLLPALTLDAVEGFSDPKSIVIGIGMWLGIVMGFNVWFVIWPNQQRALNIDNRFPDLPQPQKDAAAKTAAMFSRINTMLSVPMLFCMVGATHMLSG